MKILMVLYFINYNLKNNDTLLLPFCSGKVIENKLDNSYVTHPIGIFISPTNEFVVRSCSEGTDKKISKLRDGNLITVSSLRGLYYCYSPLANIKVIKGEKVHKGTLLGNILRVKDSENNLSFSVLRNDEFLDAKKYLVYSKHR